MKSPLLIAFIFFVTFNSLCVTRAESHDKFLHCLSLHSSSSISKVIYSQTNSSYSSILESSIQNLRFSTNATSKPLLIVTPLHASHVQATIRCSKRHGLQIRTRSGGHDMEGLSYVSNVPFVVVDLVNLRSVDVDVKSKTAWVESGATLGELHYMIAQKSGTLGFPTGTCHTVGVGGHFSGGGFGPLSRKYGLAIDNIIDARLIDANGDVLDRKSMGEDLFWAIRGGGGGNFGIVLDWKLKLVEVPSTVTVFTLTKTSQQNATGLIHRWQYVAPVISRDVFLLASLSRANSDVGKQPIQVTFRATFLGKVDELVSLMNKSFPELGLVKQDCTEMSWIQSVVNFAQFPVQNLEILLDRTVAAKSFHKVKSDYVKEPIPELVFKGIERMLREEEGRFVSMNLVPYGARMDEIMENETAFPHRGGNIYNIMYIAGEVEENWGSRRFIRLIRSYYSYMTPFVSKSPRQAYVNYRDLDIGVNGKEKMSYDQSSIWGLKYYKNNFEKLVKVKSLVDPENFFKHEQSIPSI